MRFLMLNWRDPSNPEAGGAERVSRAYLAALVQRGHQVHWFANDFAGATRDEAIDGIKITRGGGRGTSIWKALQWYRRQPRFDLVIDQHHGIPWFAPWWCRTNCIAYIHEVLGPIWKAFYRFPLSTIGQFQERWTHWLYRRVPFWTPSSSTQRELRKHRVREVKVIPNGTDATPVTQLESKPLRPPLRLVVVTRLAPNKRVDHAIQATRLLVRGGIDCHLTIVGAGEVEAQLREMAADSELQRRVSFMGRLPESEKNETLRQAHLLVHTSVREGWGLNVIEANAMGTPAVVYPVPGLVDSTLHDETGIVTSRETPEAVEDSVTALLKAPGKYDRLRDAAWRRSKTFRWENVLPQACEWLEQQAAGPGSKGRQATG
jgi:glycosyltransferase involved in cell wall biosynthesis